MNFETHLAFGSSNLCQWSPNGRILAVLESKCRLVLRDAATLDVLRTEVMVSGSTEDSIDIILFSPDSQFILASDFKTGTTFVYKVGNDKVTNFFLSNSNFVYISVLLSRQFHELFLDLNFWFFRKVQHGKRELPRVWLALQISVGVQTVDI